MSSRSLPLTPPASAPAEFLARLGSLLPVMEAKALPEVSLPSSFEEHCPGGLSSLAVKTRAVLAQSVSHPVDGSNASSAPAASLAAAPDMGYAAGSLPGGRKRQRDASDAVDAGADAGGAAFDYRRLSAFGDEIVGTAAAIAVFGWRSASPAFPAEGPSSNGGVAGDDAGAVKTTQYRLCCALCNRRLVTDNFLALDVGGPQLGAGAGVEAPQAVGSPGGRGGMSGGSGKRRRLSGGGTPLKRMDLAIEHRSFCPWASVHPPLEGERIYIYIYIDVETLTLSTFFFLRSRP